MRAPRLPLDGRARSRCIFCQEPLVDAESGLMNHLAGSGECWGKWKRFVRNLELPAGGS
jgi:hypothetical protein